MKKAFTPHFPIEFEAIHKSRRDQKDAEFRDEHNGTLHYGALSCYLSVSELPPPPICMYPSTPVTPLYPVTTPGELAAAA